MMNEKEQRESSSASMPLASQGQRFGTMLLDMIFYFVFALILGAVLGLIGLGDLIQDMNDTLLGFVILLIYYVPQEAFSGRTLGKLITGTKAVKEDGTELSFGHALGRTLCRFIPFEAFSFFGGNGRPRGWHDKIPKTKVISIKTGDNKSKRLEKDIEKSTESGIKEFEKEKQRILREEISSHGTKAFEKIKKEIDNAKSSFLGAFNQDLLDLLKKECLDKDQTLILLYNYKKQYNEDLIEKLKDISSQYDKIKKYLTPFIDLEIVEPNYPHKRIIKI